MTRDELLMNCKWIEKNWGVRYSLILNALTIFLLLRGTVQVCGAMGFQQHVDRQRVWADG